MSCMVINAIKSVLAHHGVPEVLVTDNGTQYSSKEFADFSRDWGFEHQTASPHYPRSNGVAESAVKSIKQMLKKCLETRQDFHKALLAYHQKYCISAITQLLCRMVGHQVNG